MSDNHKKETEGLAWHRVLGICSIVLACGVPLLHLPAQIYAGSTQDFNYPFGTDLAAVAAVIAAIPVLLAIPLFLPWRRLVRGWAQAWFVIAILVWVSGYLLVLDMGKLDGRTVDLKIPGGFTLVSIGVLVVAGALSLLVAVRAPRIALAPVLILDIAAFAGTVSRMGLRPGTHVRSSPAGVARLTRFSASRNNVLVIILDTFQSDVFEEILNKQPDLQGRMDGFVFFPDTVAPAKTTFLSLPAIHSGRLYDVRRSMPEIYREDVRAGSFFAALAKAGYESTTVASTGCPEGASCVSANTIAGVKVSAGARSEYGHLVDIALVRVAPGALKKLAFNRGSGWFEGWGAGTNVVNRASMGMHMLKVLEEGLTASANAPTAKLVHIQTPHPPVELGPDCRPLPKPEPFERSGMIPQCRCAIEGTLGVLAQLQKARVYDNTTIFVIGDHGAGFRLPATGPADRTETAWRSMAGSANPLLLWKPKGRRGPLKIERRQVALADIAATVCEQTNSCSGFPGVPLNRDGERNRTYMDYTWADDMWSTETIPVVRWFSIQGPVRSIASWHRVRPPEFPMGKWVEFGAKADMATYLDWGWSGIERWGVWSDARTSSMSFSLPATPTKALRFIAKVRSFVSPKHPAITVTVAANGTLVASWDFRAPRPPREVELVLPASVWAGGNSVRLSFDIDSPASPVEIGSGKDPRELGIGLEAIMLR